MKSFFRIAWLSFSLLVAAGHISTPASGAVATDPKILRVGVAANSPPMVFKQGGQVSGAEADMAALLGRALGREVVFVEEPWESLIDALCEGRIDIIMSGMSVTPARRYRIAFTDPYLKVGQMALIRSGEKYSYVLNLATQAQRGVALKAGTTADFLVKQEFPQLKRKYYKNGSDAAAALIKKKVDLFISDAPIIWHLAGLNETKGLTVMPLVLSQEELAWGIRREDGQLLESVNAFLKKAREGGELNRIFKKWLPGFQ